ncbi:hypothetical protein FD08_GL004655 [Lentilactobacillus parakefiri DSM 10551]|nr:hypothetical protein FD08_GL004655 [Lentilactobacillus parakefiri DSM 10551]
MEKMKKVLLICESGISTNLLARSAKPFVELYNADVELIPTDIDNASEYLDEGVQLVLVAPQATYLDKELSLFGEGIPVKTIPDEIYGWANGEKLIKFIMAQLSPIEAA